MEQLLRLGIVKMEARHIERLAEIEKICFSSPWTAEGLAEELTNTLAVFYVAEVDGATAGYIGMHHIIDAGYITNVAVHPDYRRMGVATHLLRVDDAFAREHNFTELSLEVRRSNSVAINIYKSMGFGKVGVRRNFYTNPAEDGLIMKKFY